MIKHNRRILAVALAAVGFSGAAIAQQPVSGLNTVAPGVVAKAPAAAPLGPLGAPTGQPMGLEQLGAPTAPAGAAGVFGPQPGAAAAPSPMPANQDRVTLKETNAVRAQTELLRAQLDQIKLQSELRKAQDALKASDAASLQSQLEAAKASDPKAAAAAAAPAPEPELPVAVLMTYGVDGRRYAEIRVGEEVDTFVPGDKLPSGHVVKAIENGSVTLVKGKGKRAKVERMRVSRSAAQETYSAERQRVAEAAPPAPAAAAPASLPALGGNAGQSVLNQLMRQNGIPPLPRQ